MLSFRALTLSVGRQEEHLASKKSVFFQHAPNVIFWLTQCDWSGSRNVGRENWKWGL